MISMKSHYSKTTNNVNNDDDDDECDASFNSRVRIKLSDESPSIARVPVSRGEILENEIRDSVIASERTSRYRFAPVFDPSTFISARLSITRAVLSYP